MERIARTIAALGLTWASLAACGSSVSTTTVTPNALSASVTRELLDSYMPAGIQLAGTTPSVFCAGLATVPDATALASFRQGYESTSPGVELDWSTVVPDMRAWCAMNGTVKTVNAHGQYGNPARYAPYWAPQATGDCVEQSARLAMDALAGQEVVSPSDIDHEAYALGVTGSDFNGSSLSTQLFVHYGFSAVRVAGMTQATLRDDLAGGDAVQAVVNANTIWKLRGVSDGTKDRVSANHAVIVEAVDRATGAVTLGDTGGEALRHETVPWATFTRAWLASGYTALVISK